MKEGSVVMLEWIMTQFNACFIAGVKQYGTRIVI